MSRITTLTVSAHRDAEPVLIDSLSVSIGVALYPSTARTVEDLLHAADTALYRAKATGRNRVTFQSSLNPAP